MSDLSFADIAIVLDGIGFMDQYMAEQPEAILEYSDWMWNPIQGYAVTLDGLKLLLEEQARILIGGKKLPIPHTQETER